MNKILIVDDEARVLKACRRNLAKHFQVDIAEGPEVALQKIGSDGPYAVMVTDMRMPGMDGLELLAEVRKRAPATVRMMLTGNADQLTAARAVNEGNVFRFLNKPCEFDQLATFITAGIRQYELENVEREMLEHTVKGAVKLMSELVATRDPQTALELQRVTRMAVTAGQFLKVERPWELEVASMVYKLGTATVPSAIVVKESSGGALSKLEREMLNRLPQTAYDLLVNVPRFEEVARIVLYQDKHFDGGGFPVDDVAGTDIPVEARILKIVCDIAHLESLRAPRIEAFKSLRQRHGVYDERILDELQRCLCPQSVEDNPPATVSLSELEPGNVLYRDIVTHSGKVLLQAGTVLTRATLDLLLNSSTAVEIEEPIQVRTPMVLAEHV